MRPKQIQAVASVRFLQVTTKVPSTAKKRPSGDLGPGLEGPEPPPNYLLLGTVITRGSRRGPTPAEKTQVTTHPLATTPFQGLVRQWRWNGKASVEDLKRADFCVRRNLAKDAGRESGYGLVGLIRSRDTNILRGDRWMAAEALDADGRVLSNKSRSMV